MRKLVVPNDISGGFTYWAFCLLLATIAVSAGYGAGVLAKGRTPIAPLYPALVVTVAVCAAGARWLPEFEPKVEVKERKL